MIAPLLFFGCGGAKKISGGGLKYVNIGDVMPPEGLNQIKGHAVRDTIFNEDGYIWRALILKYKTGKVYVEEDFFNQNLVNRIRIETPDLVSRKSITIGMNFGELKTLGDDWDVNYLESYGFFDVASIDYPSIHYLIKSNINTKDSEKLENDAKIVSIVVM